MLLIFSCNFFTLAIFLSLKGHLVHARSARKRSMVLSGSISSPLVNNCIRLVVMPNGKHFVKYVRGVIVG